MAKNCTLILPNTMNVNNIIVAPKGPAIKLVNQYNIDYKSIDINKKEKINEIVMDINSIIMEKNINIIHAHSPIAQMIGSICNILTGVPVVVTNHSVLHCNYIDKRYSSMANKYICISNEVAKHCVEEGISKDKITIINNCVEIIDEPRESGFFTEGNIRITYISRIVHEKFQSIINLLSAVQEIDKFKLFIIGDGNMLDELRKIVQKINKNNIYILGSKSNVSNYIQNSDVVVGVGRVLLEAIANGKFAICLGNVNYPGLLNKDKLKKISEVNFTDRNTNREFKKVYFINDINRIYNNFKSEFDNLLDTYKYLCSNFSVDISALKHYNLYKSIVNPS